MAKMGLKYYIWAKMTAEPTDAKPTYAPGKIMGKMVSINVTVSNSEGELYADDMLSEYASEFSSAEMTTEVDNIALADQAEMYGAQYTEDGELNHYGDDTPPYGAIGGLQVLMVHGVRKFRTWIYWKAKAIMPDMDGTTKGSSISFGTEPLKSKIMSPNFGPWYTAREFDSEDAATAYLKSKLGVASYHSVEVQVQGAQAGTEGVSPAGTIMVADGEDLELTITGTATALYDNGTDSVGSVSAGKYTLDNVTAGHKIAVIF